MVEEAIGNINFYTDPSGMDYAKTYPIETLIAAIMQKKYGKDVRFSIAAALKVLYIDATAKGNANMEVSMSRGNFDTLFDRLQHIDDNADILLNDIIEFASRLDTLIASAGNGTIPTELTDIKIGADGYVYENAGSAVRNTGKIVESNFKVPVTLTQGGYINAPTGEFATHSNTAYKSSDFILIGGAKTLRLDTKFSGAADGYAFYDKNKKFISGSNIYSKDIAVPNNAAYFRFTAYSIADSSVRLFLIYKLNDLMQVLNTISQDSLVSNLNKLISIDYTITNKRYIVAANGVDATIEDTRFSSSSFINISNVKNLTLNSNFSGYSDGFAFYDQNKNFISGSTTFTSQITVPENAVYFRFTIFNIDPTLTYVKGDYSFYKLSQNISSISGVVQDKMNYSYAIGKTLMIGDSLTSGAYYDSTFNGKSIAQNIPYYLGKMTNETVKNGGKSGWYPSNWYTSELPNHDVTQYDTFFIWLGTNKGLTNTLDADVNAYSDYNQFAATETGYYCRLIEYIKQHNPEAAIHLSTCFATTGNLAETNLTIRNIATKYDLHVIDLSDLNVASHPELHLNNGNTHFGKAGNIYIANRIIQSVNDYYNSNPIKLEFGLTDRID